MKRGTGRNDGDLVSAPRLLLVVNVSWFFISHRLVLALAAKAAGYDVHVATRVTSPEDAETISKAGVKLHHIEIGRGESGLLYDLRSVWLLKRLYREVRPDLVHHVGMKPVVLGGLIARLDGIQSIVQGIPGLGYMFVSGGRASAVRRKLMMWALRISCNGPGTLIITQNVEDLDTLIRQKVTDKQNGIVIRGSGVDVGAIAPCPETAAPIRVVLAARMLREKGVMDFVEAAQLLRQSGVAAEFLLAGDPDPSNPGSLTLKQLRAWDAAGAVQYLGFVEDIPKLFASSHIVCLPTYYGEGVPKVLVEAAACSRAIVTTDWPGCRDIVRNGVNGLLVPAHDVQALIAALKRLIGDADLRQQFGMAGRKLAANEFDLKLVLEQTLAAYRKLLLAESKN